MSLALRMAAMMIGGVAAESDTYWSSVKLLMHGDGANGGTTFTDSSGINTFTTSGSPITSTGQVKFGTASLYFNGSSYITPSSMPAFGTGDYTIECWIMITSTPGTWRGIIGNLSGANDIQYEFVVDSAQKLHFGTNNIAGGISASALSANIWYHAAAVRSSGVSTMYLNGVGGTGVAFTANLSSTTAPRIGSIPVETSIAGYIDDLRVTVGVARYTANFTPPTAAFPNN